MLSDINLPIVLATIEDAAFERCGSLTTLTLPISLKEIGGDAFKECTSLAHIELPASLKEIGGSAFQKCISLREVVLNCPTPPAISGDTFKDVKATFIIPQGTQMAYMSNKKWAKVTGLKEK